jgi:integrase
MYGSGLRILECITLRVKDIDLDRREIVVRGGKGKKDRRTPLAEVCVRPLKRVLEQGRERFHKDERAGVRTTGLSAALAWKYPTAESEWRWARMCSRRRERLATMVVCSAGTTIMSPRSASLRPERLLGAS